MKSVQIIRATPKDTEVIMNLGRTTFYDSHVESAPKSEMDAYLYQAFAFARVKSELEDEKNIFHLVSVEGKAVAYSKIIYNTANLFMQDSRISKLERLYIDKSMTGKNLGRKILEFNKDLAIENDQLGFWLTVWTKNQNAIKFYEKNGFTEVGGVYFQVGKKMNPNHLMYLGFGSDKA